MKKKEILLVIILFFSLNVKALTKDSLIFGKKNYVIMGILETRFFSYIADISYNRMLFSKNCIKLDAKIGIVSNGLFMQGLQTGTSFYIGGKRHFFEIGVNLEFVCLRGFTRSSGLRQEKFYTPPKLSFSFYPIIGYRYFSKKSFTFRLYYIPIITYTNSKIYNQYNNFGFSFGFGF